MRKEIPQSWFTPAARRENAARLAKRQEAKEESEPLTNERKRRLKKIRFHAGRLAWHLSGASEFQVLQLLKEHWPQICRAELALVKEEE